MAAAAAEATPAASTAGGPVFPLLEVLGETLTVKDGSVPTADRLAGKVVGLYFSAHWCPPCRQFTPMLSRLYQSLTAAGKNLEIVFVSSDREKGGFDEYFGSMPWTALPFANRQAKAELSKAFKVTGIPCLVLLDEERRVITKKGVEAVFTDKKGADFPWRPKTAQQLLGPTLVTKNGEVPMAEAIAGKTIAIYFSAHWCPPCRRFTPMLAKMYEHMKGAGRDDFEIIFVSWDNDEEEFDEYYGEMPWTTLPFGTVQDALTQKFKVEGIPNLITIAPDGGVINSDAAQAAGGDPTGANFPWAPAPIANLSQTPSQSGKNVNECPAVIVFCENAPAAVKTSAKEALMPFATEVQAAGRLSEDGPEFLCFTAPTPSGPAPIVRKLVQLPDTSTAATLVILDIPDNGGYYVSPADEITEDAIANFISLYRDGALERKQLPKQG